MIVLGVIGYPLKHTLSPVMHNSALCEMGVRGIYLAMEVKPERFEDAVKGLSAIGFMGYNVTIPYKVQIIPYLDSLTEEAKSVGAVNTVIVYPSGKSVGDNTDIYGFMSTFSADDKELLKGKRAVIIGAGGGSRAVGVGLIQMGLKQIHLYDINPKIADETFKVLKNAASDSVEISVQDIKDLNLDEASLLVNATPVGMHPNINQCAIDTYTLEHLEPHAIVFDLIYRPQETLLLQTASRKGFKTYNGTEMLVQQGALSLSKWINDKIPVDTMRESLLEVLNNEQ